MNVAVFLVIYSVVVLTIVQASSNNVSKRAVRVSGENNQYTLFWSKKRAEKLFLNHQNAIDLPILDSLKDYKLSKVVMTLDKEIDVNAGKLGKECESTLKKVLLKALFSSRWIVKDKYSLFNNGRGYLVFGVKQLLGSKLSVFATNKSIRVHSTIDSTTYTIDYQIMNSANRQTLLKNEIPNCVLRISIVNNHTTSTVSVQLQTFTTSNKHKAIYKELSSLLFDVCAKTISDELLLNIARIDQINRHRQATLEKSKLIKLQEVDKIINPEKYKATRPGARSPGNGNGRFTPSAATLARRSVKSGG